MIKWTSGILLFFFAATTCFGQGPWNNPLKMAWSTDGIAFTAPTIFQDSAGVPSLVKWKGDTLAAVFQWFRAPNPSPSWDRVAVKFSYDKGINWTQPTPIVVNGLPAGYQRPFDPTLCLVGGDSLRIYFSSSNGIPPPGLDSTVNTYSAKSADGINYFFEPNPRVDEPAGKVIDPAVIYFNNSWHFAAPIGAPQQGAYHYVSPNGINFSKVANIPSDNSHNWTGNYMIESSSELRFYGSGQTIWFNSSPNGGTWNGYVPTNIQGGDPSVVKITPNNYLIVFVGPPYPTTIENIPVKETDISLFPNPASDRLIVHSSKDCSGNAWFIVDVLGRLVKAGVLQENATIIPVAQLVPGAYYLKTEGTTQQFLKQ